jgi:hypothetical protein
MTDDPIELSEEFDGTGEMVGYRFVRILEPNGKAYFYGVLHPEGDYHYEVFKKTINTRFNNISYPRSNAFGLTAWCFVDKDEALKKYEELSE